MIVGLLLGLLLVACGNGSGVGPRDPASLHTQLLIEAAPEGADSDVRVDSASWNPAVLLPTGADTPPEVVGPFMILFHNAGDRALSMRYDLRFLDDGGFLVDNWIPSGLPVILAPGQITRQMGQFIIRTSPDIGRFGLATMQIAVRLSLADTTASVGGP